MQRLKFTISSRLFLTTKLSLSRRPTMHLDIECVPRISLIHSINYLIHPIESYSVVFNLDVAAHPSSIIPVKNKRISPCVPLLPSSLFLSFVIYAVSIKCIGYCQNANG